MIDKFAEVVPALYPDERYTEHVDFLWVDRRYVVDVFWPCLLLTLKNPTMSGETFCSLSFLTNISLRLRPGARWWSQSAAPLPLKSTPGSYHNPVPMDVMYV